MRLLFLKLSFLLIASVGNLSATTVADKEFLQRYHLQVAHHSLYVDSSYYYDAYTKGLKVEWKVRGEILFTNGLYAKLSSRTCGTYQDAELRRMSLITMLSSQTTRHYITGRSLWFARGWAYELQPSEDSISLNLSDELIAQLPRIVEIDLYTKTIEKSGWFRSYEEVEYYQIISLDDGSLWEVRVDSSTPSESHKEGVPVLVTVDGRDRGYLFLVNEETESVDEVLNKTTFVGTM